MTRRGTPAPVDNALRALHLWRGGKPIAGTVGETYFRSLGLGIDWRDPPDPDPYGYIRDTWRFSPTLYCREGNRNAPGLLIPIADFGRKVVGVWRVYLAEDGSGRATTLKDPELPLGTVKGCAIRLTPAAPEMFLARGLADALALRRRYPTASVWACPWPRGLETVELGLDVASVVLAVAPGEDAKSLEILFRDQGRAAIATNPLAAPA